MGKFQEVREFDIITKNDEYKDAEYSSDSKCIYLEPRAFDDLITFIQKFDGEADNSDILEFMRITSKRNIGEAITIQNYVGLIQMKSGYRIQIIPKIDFVDQEDGSDKTKEVLLKMLHSLKEFSGKAFNAASLDAKRMNFYELYINMYLQEVRTLVKHGIRSDYIRKEENLRVYKGKLLVNKHIKANLAHKERFYMAYDEFHPNSPENRIVKATLLKLQKITESAQNSREIRQLLSAFDDVEPSNNYSKDFSKVVLSRNTRDYKMLIQWSKVFLMGKSFTPFEGDTSSRALLFPMEVVFERYVAQQMIKVFSPDGWIVTPQSRRQYLFTKPDNRFALQPDIILEKEGRTVVLDTKWKRLVPNESLNYGISQADMYQMYAYSKKYGNAEVWLLYPVTNAMRDHDQIEFYDGDNTFVRLFFVDVARPIDSLAKLKKKIETI